MNPLSKVIRRAFSSNLYGEVLRVRPSISVLTGHVQVLQGDKRNEELQSEKSTVPLPSISDIAKHFVNERTDSIQINMLDKDTSSEKVVLDALKKNAGLVQVGGALPLALASDFIQAGAKRVVISSFLNSQGEIDWASLNEWRDKLNKDHIVLGFSTHLDDDSYWIYDTESNKKSSLPLDQKVLSSLAPYCSHFLINLVPPKKEKRNVQFFLRLCTHLEYESPIPVELTGWLPSAKDAEKSEAPETVYNKVSIQVSAGSPLWKQSLGDFPPDQGLKRPRSESQESGSRSDSSTIHMGAGMGAGAPVSSGPGTGTNVKPSGQDSAESTTGSGGESMRRASTATPGGSWEVPPSDAERTEAGNWGAQPQSSEAWSKDASSTGSGVGTGGGKEFGKDTSQHTSQQASEQPSISPVEHDFHAERFVATLHTESGRTVTAELTYKKISTQPLIYEFDHTYTPNEMRGRGVAAKLADKAFEFVKEHEGKVLPTCDYIATTYLKNHPHWENYITKV